MVRLSSLDVKICRANTMITEWNMLYCRPITTVVREELVGIRIAAEPPIREHGSIKLSIDLLSPSFLL